MACQCVTRELHLGIVGYEVTLGGGNGSVTVEVVDATGTTVAKASDLKGMLKVPKAKLWWPYSMSGQNFTDMYTLKVSRYTNCHTMCFFAFIILRDI